LRSVPGSLSYALVRFDDVAFDGLERVAPAQKDAVLAVSTASMSGASDSLLVLSNVRTAVNQETFQRLRRTLGNAYFVGLMASVDFRSRCRGASQAYSAYLLDAQVAERKNLARALAIWSDIVLRTAAPGGGDVARLKEQQALVERVLRTRLNARLDDRQGLADQLQGRGAGPRAEFSNQKSNLFKQALVHVQTAMQSPDPARRAAWLALARAKLLSLVRDGAGPACSGEDGGLFGRGLDPFFYLSLIDAYTALEQPVAADSAAALR
jgi:hypothetical protein